MGEKMSVESIEKEEVMLKNKLDALNEKKKQLFVSEGVSIICSLCKKYVRSPNADELKENICWRCIRKQRKEKMQKKLLDKMKGALLLDIKIATAHPLNSTLKSVTLFKDGSLFLLTADGDFDGDCCDSWINMEVNKSISDPFIVDRPGTKPRGNDKVIDAYTRRSNRI